MRITLFTSERHAHGVRVVLENFEALSSLLSEVEVTESKKGQRGWSPATFNMDKRELVNVEELAVLVLDIDVPELPELPDDLSYFAHTTYRGNWRLVIETSRPYNRLEHAPFRRAVMADLGIDETLGPREAADASRFYYGPCAKKLEDFRTVRGSGGPLDVDAYLADAPEPTPATPPPTVAVPALPVTAGVIDLKPVFAAAEKRHVKETSRAVLWAIANQVFAPKAGSRHNSLHHAASCLATLTDPPQSEEWGLTIAEGIFRNMGDQVLPEGVAVWRAEWLQSWRRAAERRAALDRARAEYEANLFPVKVEGAVVSDEWKSQLITRETKSGVVLASVGKNIELILRHDPRINSLRWHVMESRPEWTDGPLKGVHPDALDTALTNWLVQSEYRLSVPRGEAAANLYLVSRERLYDPLAEWLNSLRWDGKARAFRLLQDYFQIEYGNLGFLQLISEKWLIAAVARALQPGCQVDTTLLLADNGDGGQGKTTFCRVMGGEWYGKVDTHLDKEALQKVTGKWIIELAEMAANKRTDRERMRGFLTDTSDRFRPPYGRVVQEFPRRCLFVATSNDETPIQDAFGQRRYWPVRVTKDLKRTELERDREQLFAEAVVLFRGGEQWWLDKAEEEMAKEERATMLETDALAEHIMDWVRSLPPDKRPRLISIPDYLQQKLGLMPSEALKANRSAAIALRAAGFVREKQSARNMWRVPEKVLYFGVIDPQKAFK